MREGRFIQIPMDGDSNIYLDKSKYADKEKYQEGVEFCENDIIKRKKHPFLDFLRENNVGWDFEKMKIIGFVQESVNKVLRKYGLHDLYASSDAIYMLNSSAYNELSGAKKEPGRCFPTFQAIAICDDENKTKTSLASTLFHEFMHLYAFTRVRVMNRDESDERGNLFVDRTGLVIINENDSKKLRFEKLNEAIVEKLTLQFLNSIHEDEHFKEEFELIKESHPELLAKGAVLFARESEGGEHFYDIGHSYSEAVGKLDGLINEIFENNKERFSSPDEVFDVFVKASFSGNIIDLAKLIEKTKGKGSFREISENF